MLFSTFLFTTSVSSCKSTQLDIVDVASLIRRCGVTNDRSQPLWLHSPLTLARPSGMLAQLRMTLLFFFARYCLTIFNHHVYTLYFTLSMSCGIQAQFRMTLKLLFTSKQEPFVVFLAHRSALLMIICHATLRRVLTYMCNSN